MTLVPEMLSKQLPSTTTGRILRGLGSATLAQFLAGFSAIVLVSFFLRTWGTTGYGKWLVLTAFLSYLKLLDFGGQNYIQNLLSIAYSGNNNINIDDFENRFSEGMSFFTAVSLAGFLLLCIVVVSIPGLSLPGWGQPLTIEDRFVLLFIGSAFLLSIPGGVYVTVYRATGHLARGTMLGNVFKLSELLGSIILLYMNINPMVYSAFILGNTTVNMFFFIVDTRHHIYCSRKLRINLTFARKGIKHLTGSLHFWLIGLAGAIKMQAVLIILLSATTSASIVSTYATHRTAAGIVGYVGALLLAPLWPELTFTFARNDYSGLKRIALFAVKITVWFSGLIALVTWVFLPTIYPIWTGKELQFQPLLLTLFLIQGVLSAGWMSSGWSLLATNKHRSLSYWMLANSIVTVVIASVVAPKFGIIGVAIATLIADITCGAIAYPKLASRLLNVPSVKLYMSILTPMLALILMGIPLVTISLIIKGWQLVLFRVVIIVLFLYPTARLSLGKRDMDWLVSKLWSVTKARI